MKFGTSGLRGLSVDLLGKASFAYPAAFAGYLADQGLVASGTTILLARDFRDSSEQIVRNAASALSASGLTPVDCGTLPTPALALYGLETGAASIMVTGSHIPADRNGLKFYVPSGEIDKADEQGISAIAEATMQSDWTMVASQIDGASILASEMFIERNQQILEPGALRDIKVGVYQHSTVARDMLVDILEYYGAEVISLGRSETFIPVDTEAVSEETIAQTRKWAKEYGLDAIVSADGDGDRPLLTDENGDPVKGDILGLVCARFLGARAVVTPVTSNSGIEKAGDFKVLRTRVGSPYVIAGMEEAVNSGFDAVVGFEANGGTLTATEFKVPGGILKPLPTRDCFLPILAVLDSVRRSGKSVSEYCGSLGLPVTAADRLTDFPIERSAALMAWLLESRANLEKFLAPVGRPEVVENVDGLRVTLDDGRFIHFRPSGNAPEMRCYVEAEGDVKAAGLLATGLQLIREWAPA